MNLRLSFTTYNILQIQNTVPDEFSTSMLRGPEIGQDYGRDLLGNSGALET